MEIVRNQIPDLERYTGRHRNEQRISAVAGDTKGLLFNWYDHLVSLLKKTR